MAHMYERIMQTIIYSVGGSVGFSQGDIRLLPEDLQSLRPTIIPAVPRLLNRLYDKVSLYTFNTNINFTLMTN